MPDKILLLPESIANQIAAGEVIQRPASAVKELLENAVDAGATEVRLLINDAGKSLVQVTDNGSGMTETDARMCFERHATSKIRTIDDLFHIRTMGFRGEALASIAAVAQVELKTRKEGEETGTYIEIENSQVKKQQPAGVAQGTSIAMKNLFFNVPARRNFLKSNAAEMRHIIEEFTRVALAFPHVFFSLTSNGQQLFHLDAGTLKQRILQLLAGNYNTKLVTVNEQTDYLNIYGFAGKPETARKTRGDQYFFVNNRYIKSAYLNHAVMNAYQDMITSDSYPMYVLFIDLDPMQVDVNVHPTKQEIKFIDEKIVYAFVQAAIKHSLAQFSITPTLDFELDPSIQHLSSIQQPFTEEKRTAVSSSSIFKTFTEKNQAHLIEPGQKQGLKHWRDFYGISPSETGLGDDQKTHTTITPHDILHGIKIQQGDKSRIPGEDIEVIQLMNTYILLPHQHGFLLIHQQAAHERVLYEQLMNAINGKPVATQRSLFPATFELPSADTALLGELLPELQHLGYMIEPFGNNTFVMQGTPADMEQGNERNIIDGLLEQYKHFSSEMKFSRREKLVRAAACQQAIKSGKKMSDKEMRMLVEKLFSCEQPHASPGGAPAIIEFREDQLDKMFG